jgi:hypothetical protein
MPVDGAVEEPQLADQLIQDRTAESAPGGDQLIQDPGGRMIMTINIITAATGRGVIGLSTVVVVEPPLAVIMMMMIPGRGACSVDVRHRFAQPIDVQRLLPVVCVMARWLLRALLASAIIVMMMMVVRRRALLLGDEVQDPLACGVEELHHRFLTGLPHGLSNTRGQRR